jgi:hypothetical protein
MTFADQIHGERAPEYLQDFARRIGGLTPNGDPLYRVVRAESVFAKCFQTFTDWDDNIAPEKRGGVELSEDGVWQLRTAGNIRTVEELRSIEVYPGMTGWLVERWYPVDMLRWRRQEWEAKPALGIYPERGFYLNCNTKAIRNVPTLHQVEGLINAVEYKIANKQGTVESRIKDREERILKAMELKRQAERQRNIELMRSVTRSMLGSSLAAGRMREVIANRMRARGIRIGHVGN